jgi:glycosyltransferase involved in cell wall biosynthesis
MQENNFDDRCPLVSIIVTSYNHANIIGTTIESALKQDYPNLEIIISDNCSTDNSDEVIRNYALDKRIRYSRNETNIGMLPNFRKATYELAKGRYITYVSSDDYLTDNSFISDGIKLINQYKNVLLVFGKGRVVDSKNEVLSQSREYPFYVQEFWSGKDVFLRSMDYGFLTWCACLMERESLYRVKGLQSDHFSADLEANYKIMANGNVCFINRYCYDVLFHGMNATSTVSAKDKILFLSCLDNIGSYAQQKMPEETDGIKQWKHYFLFANAWNELKFLKTKSEDEFEKFKNAVKDSYPEVYKAIYKKWKYRLFTWFWSVKNILKSN